MYGALWNLFCRCQDPYIGEYCSVRGKDSIGNGIEMLIGLRLAAISDLEMCASEWHTHDICYRRYSKDRSICCAEPQTLLLPKAPMTALLPLQDFGRRLRRLNVTSSATEGTHAESAVPPRTFSRCAKTRNAHATFRKDLHFGL